MRAPLRKPLLAPLPSELKVGGTVLLGRESGRAGQWTRSLEREGLGGVMWLSDGRGDCCLLESTGVFVMEMEMSFWRGA